MKFTNDPSHNSDISTRSDISKPTVYYMFGKVCSSEKKYVVTDYDMLSFCRSWLSSAERPQNLAAELQSKYLLILGNNYSDWLSRFVCFSLKAHLDSQPMGMVQGLRVTPDAMSGERRRMSLLYGIQTSKTICRVHRV